MKVVNAWAFPEADQFMVAELKHDGTYQLSHLEKALEFVTEFGCAIDCGAHIGTWSRVMSQRFARVVAFEPSADTFECLEWNLRTHGCTNVEAHQCAVGSEPGHVAMALDAVNEARANTGARFVTPGGDIPVVTIDSFNFQNVGFIKLDIEGSEPAALRGAKDTLRRCQPVVLFENKRLWTKTYGMPKGVVEEFLTAHGYEQVAAISMDRVWRPRVVTA